MSRHQTFEETFNELLGRTECRAAHMETRDSYMPDDPRFVSWSRGHREDPDDPTSWWGPWHQTVRDTVTRGVAVHRARVVSEPLSAYMRFEYDITFTNVTAGEQVRWLSRRHASDLALPGNDFWLFDDFAVVFLHFTGEGAIPTDEGDYELSTDPHVIRMCATSFDAVWQRATPHAKYWPG